MFSNSIEDIMFETLYILRFSLMQCDSMCALVSVTCIKNIFKRNDLNR